MPFRMSARPRRQRLSQTRVEQAVRDTKTRQIVHVVGGTIKLDDGRHQVRVALFDKFDDPRAESPAAAELIAALETDGWTVTHERGRIVSRLDVTELARWLEGDDDYRVMNSRPKNAHVPDRWELVACQRYVGPEPLSGELFSPDLTADYIEPVEDAKPATVTPAERSQLLPPGHVTWEEALDARRKVDPGIDERYAAQRAELTGTPEDPARRARGEE